MHFPHVSRTTASIAINLLLAAGIPGPANAASMTANSSLGNSFYLNAGTTGSFDITSLMTPANSYVAPYQISNAVITFQFSDDANDPTLGGQITNPYTPAAITSRVILQTYTDAAESASVGIGAQNGIGSTSFYNIASHLDHTTLDWSYYANNCPGYTGACNHQLFQGTSFYYTATSGYGGNFGISYALNGSNLADLSADGLLNFNLGVTGDLMLQSATITFDVAANPVPEPETYALLLAGLGVVGFASRRKV